MALRRFKIWLRRGTLGAKWSFEALGSPSVDVDFSVGPPKDAPGEGRERSLNQFQALLEALAAILESMSHRPEAHRRLREDILGFFMIIQCQTLKMRSTTINSLIFEGYLDRV